MNSRIAYLDSATLDAGDIDFSPLEALGDLTLHGVTKPEERLPRCLEADIVLVNKAVLDREILEACRDNLKFIVVTATGTNNLDLQAARELKIPVSNVSGYSTEGVAQHTLAMILNLATNVHRFAAEPEEWAKSPMFTRLDYPIIELAGKTLGIVGLGTIGKRVAALGKALGMKVIALGREGASFEGEVPRLPHNSFFANADFVTLHCPLTPLNERFINAETLQLMKPGSFLINTGRGQLIDETALLEALKSGHLGGAGLDVLSAEPPAEGHPLLDSSIPNLFVTPHTAWASYESRIRLLDAVCENIRSFQAGGEILSRVA
tara:strand:+ start:4035 stop:4997 length:963 start_codon:yes stop_codon:yes gene_type:complete